MQRTAQQDTGQEEPTRRGNHPWEVVHSPETCPNSLQKIPQVSSPLPHLSPPPTQNSTLREPQKS
ncbi:hypothetical protein PtA15_6A242 [Puccinia triticina]|uniref:Uncharacterized protein n=1 Tax=Puccinia triticina TaxID=208348 RepID=A0ABY7CLS6_9BASI|nr:uncharacterized protein PtA15_6A242 [Puccinia triticina]WAQ85614.1 hypothetical protein PtA15_6A242 [Puccinia triticina]